MLSISRDVVTLCSGLDALGLQVDLRDEDVRSIVMTLVYDGRIETVRGWGP
jgi:hypothetical protein